MDSFTALKQKRDSYARLHWSASKPPDVRMFSESNGATREITVSHEDVEHIANAVGFSRHSGADLAWYGGDELGKALQRITLHHLDEQLKVLAAKAKEEAQAVFDTLK